VTTHGPTDGAPRPTNPPPHSVKVYGATSRAEGRGASPLLAGAIAGILLALLWTLLVYVTHNPVRLAAWGVGGLVGVAVAKSAGQRGRSLGTLAAVLTIGAVILAKVLILAVALRPIVMDEILRNRDATTALFLVDMTTHRSFSPELQAAIDRRIREHNDTALSRLGAELNDRMIAEARARVASATPAERSRLVQVYMTKALARVRFGSLLGSLFRLWDVLWAALGISSPWKLAQAATG